MPKLTTPKPVVTVGTAWTCATLQRDRRLKGLIETWLSGHIFSLADLVQMVHVRLTADAASLVGHRPYPAHSEAVQGAALEQIIESMAPLMGDPKRALEAGLRVHHKLERALESSSGLNREGLALAVAQGDLLTSIASLVGGI